MRWTIGEAVVERLLREQKLKHRPTFSEELNQATLDGLETTLASASLLFDAGDYASSLSISHVVIRKSLTCLLRAQGLDIDDITGSHLTVETAALAQFGESGPLTPHRHQIRNTRLLRNDTEYQSELTRITHAQAQHALETARATREVAAKLVTELSLF